MPPAPRTRRATPAVTPDALAAARDAGARTERDRVLGILKLSRPGAERTVRRCLEDPSWSVGRAALLLLEAQRMRHRRHFAALAGDELSFEAPAATPAPEPGTQSEAERILALHRALSTRVGRVHA